MWNQLRGLFPSRNRSQLTISSHGQEACGLPFEQIQEVMKWLGLSLMAADYCDQAHVIWDGPETPVNLDGVFKRTLKRNEPTFLYRCGNRPMQPPSGYYWRLMPEYPSLRTYQLERR